MNEENKIVTRSDMRSNDNDQRSDHEEYSLEEYQKLIAEFKMKQQALESENEQLRKAKEETELTLQKHIGFYNYAPSGYFTLDRNGIILALNESASGFFQKRPDQLRGVSFVELLDTYSVSIFTNFLKEVFQSDVKLSCNLEVKTPENIPLSILIEGISMPNKVECLVDLVDISGRIKILDKLVKSELKYNSMLEELNEGVALVDLEETFTYVNQAGGQIFGIPASELRFRNAREFLNPNQFKIVQEETKKRIKGEKSRYQVSIIAGDGKEKIIAVSGVPHYNRNGELFGTLAMFSDITSQKKHEIEIEKRLKLELIVSEISNDFVHFKREYLDISLNHALEKIGIISGVDRSYIFLFSEDGLLFNNTHEWCAQGIEPQIDNLQDIPVDLMKWWMDKIRKFEVIHIPRVADLPVEAQPEREILEAQEIKSTLAIPLLTHGSILGFLGFDAVIAEKEWQNEDIRLLTVVGEIIGSGLSRLKYEESLLQINIELEQKVEERTRELRGLLDMNNAILNALPDMLFKINRDGRFVDFHSHPNKSLFVPKEEFIGKTIEQVLPESLAKQSMFAMEKAFSSEEVSWFEYQLRVSGEDRFYENRIIKISEQEALSIIRDITDRKRAEESLKTTTQNLHILIQNLPVGTLFENASRQITLVNQSFCNLFGISQSPNELIGFDCVAASESSKYLMKEPESFVERIKEVISGGIIASNDELYLNDGRIFERDYIPIKLGDELLGHLWQYRDITLRKLNERYAVLQRDLGFSLASSSNNEQALSNIVRSIIQIKEISAVGVYLMNNDFNELELIVHKGLSEDFVDKVRFYKKDDPQFEIVQKGEVLYGNYDELVPHSPIFSSNEFKQIGIIPIKYEERIIGSVNMSFQETEKINLAIQLTLEIIASQIGGTLARIKSEHDLAANQRNFKMLFETIDDFMFILDEEGRIIKTNPVVERRLGYSMEELEGMTVLEVHPPDRRNEAAFIVAEMLAGRVEVCPVPLYKKNGGIIPVETKVVAGKWNGQNALYGISRDITERLKAEKTLRESEERWHFALEGAGDGVWDIDLVNNVAYYSRQWKTMLGYAADEIENKVEEWEKRVHPDDLPKSYIALNNHIKGESEFYINEYRLLCKDGTYKWILSRGKALEFNNEGRPLRIIGTHTDITQRKELEEQLKKTIEKEKELNDLKSRFVATTSHEFRTPLASVLMISDTLITFMEKFDEKQVVSRLEKIKENVLHLTKIVNDVLQLSKMQEGKIGLNAAQEDLVDLCINVIGDFNTHESFGDQIIFKTKFKSLHAIIDSRLIIQALSNLISNAIKYSDSGSKVEIDLIESGDEILINVSDYGIGIPGNDQKYMFTPFFRAGNTATIQGNGLGLSIVMEAMQLHGGKVSFVSEFHQGSTFTLHFPLTLVREYVSL